jgi:hypothetical protein
VKRISLILKRCGKMLASITCESGKVDIMDIKSHVESALKILI